MDGKGRNSDNIFVIQRNPAALIQMARSLYMTFAWIMPDIPIDSDAGVCY